MDAEFWREGDRIRRIGPSREAVIRGEVYIIESINGTDVYLEEHHDAWDTDMFTFVERPTIFIDDVIRVGDRVRRVRGGTHRTMREGDEGKVTRRWQGSSGATISIEGYGLTGFDIRNYVKKHQRTVLSQTSVPFVEPTNVSKFKVGDKVILARNSSGLHSRYLKQSAEVIQEMDGTEIGRIQFLDGGNVLVYASDLVLLKPRVDISNFKNYVKSTLANVAKA